MTLIGGTAVAGETPFSVLDGHWHGPRLDLHIDYERMLANAQPDKPFDREPLHIKNRTGSMFVFSIGKRQFFAIIANEEMRLTGDGVEGTEVLSKKP
jgi:hypothetical protein